MAKSDDELRDAVCKTLVSNAIFFPADSAAANDSVAQMKGDTLWTLGELSMIGFDENGELP